MAIVTYYARLYANPNGGSGGGSETKSSYEGGVALSFSVNYSASRQYYVFKGWSTSSSGSVNVGSTITVTTSMTDGETNTRTIYAVWAHAKATLSYNANGGSGAPASQTVNQNEWFNLSSTTPTRTGYTFQGWGTTSSATTASYQPSGLARIVGNMTLYAVWKANTYTISYNANGGSGAPSSQTKTYGVNLTLSSTVPTRSNYNFLGWSTSNTATTATYAAGGTYTANSGATLYAVWKLATRTLTLTYNANGGLGAPASESQTVNTETAEFTVSFSEPTYAGRNFLGWALTSDGQATYTGGMPISISADTTLYAIWELKKYTISYDANGGENAPLTQLKTHGVNITLTSSAPSRTGYTFAGWALSASATVADYSSGDTFSTDANTTLYAVWTINTYTVSYNANSGSNAPASQTKTYGVALTLSYQRPTRLGYLFKGWGLTADATEASYASGALFSVDADTTLYAVWAEATYTASDIYLNEINTGDVFVNISGTLYPSESILI